jgi:hypothetical protein
MVRFERVQLYRLVVWVSGELQAVNLKRLGTSFLLCISSFTFLFRQEVPAFSPDHFSALPLATLMSRQEDD